MVLSAYIGSKDALKTYIYERLGQPVVRINVTDIQVNHVINDTLEKFVMFADAGVQLRFKTQEFVRDTAEYAMSFDTFAIIEVFDSSNLSLTTTIFNDSKVSPDYKYHPLTQLEKQDLLSIELARQYLEQANFMLKVKILYDFNTATRTLYLLDPPDENYTAGILYYQRIDYSNSNSLVYDHPWIKKYSTALTKKQWGDNLIKYTGSLLPDGLQLNGETILSEAKEEIERLEDELEMVWRLPTDFFVG